MPAYPSYGDVLGRPLTDPDRDQIRATPTWTPVRLPGPGGWWRHWVSGAQIDNQNNITPTEGTP